jgi:hypothetical protein
MNVRRIVPYAAVVILYAALFWGYRALMPAIDNEYRGPSQEFRRMASLNDEVRQIHGALREVLIRDSILPLIPPTPGVVSLLPDSSNPRTKYLQRLVQRESRTNVDVAIPIIGVSVNYAILSDLPDAFSAPRYYAGERSGSAPYCAVVVPEYNTQLPHHAMRGNLLGPCRLWARHGAAGPHITEWMKNTRGEFAQDEMAPIIVDFFELEGEPFARRFGSQFWGSFESRRCRAGNPAACERAVTASDSSRGNTWGVAMTGERWYMPRVAPGDARLLADMEQQFGTQPFRRFWKSEAPVNEAFEAAFGVALGEWVLDWSEKRYGPITVGARMKPGTILLSLIFIALFTALAVATVRGRRV